MIPSQATAEWVDERPTCGTDYSPLADFNYTDFSNGYAHSIYRGWHTIGGFPRDQISMWETDGDTGEELFKLAYPDSLQQPGTTSFRDHWVNQGYGAAYCSF